MTLIFDFTEENPDFHEQHDYPEDDDALEEVTNRLFREALHSRRNGDFEIEQFTVLHAHITELRRRGYEISCDKDFVRLR